MKAIVVYESLWGNTAAVARAIAEGIGAEARALSTAEAVGPAVADAELIVAGAPLLGFTLPTDGMRKSIADGNQGKMPAPPNLSAPSMRSWLEALPKGHGRAAAFETRLRLSPGGATAAIEQGMARAGYVPVVKAGRFIVNGKYGPLRDGELERAKRWGAELVKAIG